MNKKLLFVYNADSSLFKQVGDLIHKTISPKTYKCNLCRITYGNLGMKKQWQEFIQSLTLPVQFFYKDELKQEYPELTVIDLPAVLIVNEGKPRLLINSSEINAVHGKY